jgi:hypothetical protein
MLRLWVMHAWFFGFYSSGLLNSWAFSFVSDMYKLYHNEHFRAEGAEAADKQGTTTGMGLAGRVSLNLPVLPLLRKRPMHAPSCSMPSPTNGCSLLC